MKLVTLESLRTQCKARADMLKSKFISDETWNEWINREGEALYDLLVKTAEDYFTISTSLAVDGTQIQVDLPDDFYKLMSVDYTLNGNAVPMKKFMFKERLLYNDQSFGVVRYRVVKNTLYLNPRPSAQTLTLWYVPCFESLVVDADTLDGVNGFEEYIVIKCAIKAKDAEESDTSVLQADLSGVLDRISGMAPNRDQGEPERVTDVTASDWANRFPYGGTSSDGI